MGFREEADAMLPQAAAEHQKREAKRLSDATAAQAEADRKAKEDDEKLDRARKLGGEVVAYLIEKGVPSVPVIKHVVASNGTKTETEVGQGWHYERSETPEDLNGAGSSYDHILTDEGLPGWVLFAGRSINNPHMYDGDQAIQTLESTRFKDAIVHLVATGTFSVEKNYI